MNYVVESYENYKEEDRLTTNNARKIEFITTTRVLDEVIDAESKILDCAAGTGVYAFWLADKGHDVTAILTEMGAIIYSLAVIGAIICIAALYVSVNMLISENRHNISMLKVLGLKNREINRMIIDVNHIIIPFGIAVGLLTGYFMMVVVFRIYSGMEGVLYTPVITAQSIILTIVIVIACYAVSLLTVRRKADRVDMVESLKDNRE